MDATICNGCERVTTIADAANNWIKVQIRGDWLHFCTDQCLGDKIQREGRVAVITQPKILSRYHVLWSDGTVLTAPDLPADFPS